MRFAPHFLGLCLFGLASYACSSSSTTATTIVRPELVGVSPDDFLGSFHCGDGPDDVHSYVATLFDVGPAPDGGMIEPGFPLPSSPATPCDQQVTFSFVILNHRYVAKVDAYKADAASLHALAPGGRTQTNAAGVRVTPNWAATCGGYPLTYAPDAGGGGTGGGSAGGKGGGSPESAAGASDAENAGASGAVAADFNPPGVLSYSALTQIPHDCGVGLYPVGK